MRYTITGKNITISDALRETTINKLSKLEKYFTKENDARVTMSVEKPNHMIEVTIPLKKTIIRAEESAETMYAAIDMVVDVLERQLLRHKNKIIQKHRGHGSLQSDFMDSFDDIPHDFDIVPSNRFAEAPMDPEDACMEMDLLGYHFLTFRNRITDEVNVVYKIGDDRYGLIEPS